MNPRQPTISKLQRAVIHVLLALLRAVYSALKLLPSQELITVLSRQCDEPTEDLRLLEGEFRKRRLNFRILTKRIPKTFLGKATYLIHLLRQLFLVSRSGVLVVDGYSIVASALRHKKALRVIQIWHASGAFKHFGYSALGAESGPNPEMSRIFRLHANYSHVLCSGSLAVQPFSEAFGIDRTNVLQYPLPRLDLLSKPSRDEISMNIYEEFSHFKDQKVVIWAPTSIMVGGLNRPSTNLLVSAANTSGYQLIESLEKCHIDPAKLVSNPYSKFSTLEWLTVSAGLITDQSSMIFEAIFAGLPFVILVDPREREKLFQASYLDSKVWDSFITDDADKAFSMISSQDYISKCLALRKDYITEPRDKSYTKDLVDLIEDQSSSSRHESKKR